MVAALAAALAACNPLIAGYSLQAYQNATTLKADAAALAAKSTTPYASNVQDIDALTLRLNEAYEFSKGEPYNALSAAQWQVLLSPTGPYGGFIALWQSEGKLSPDEAKTRQVQLDRAFDYIICLEANKQAAAACGKPEALQGS